MKKNAEGFIDLDPAIAATLSSGDKRQAERSMSKPERKSAKRERAKAEARRGARALYDLPPELIKAVKDLAEKNETSASQLAKLAVWMLLRDLKNGEFELREYLVSANKNPQYEYMVELSPMEIGRVVKND
jgi:hypothetical protein